MANLKRTHHQLEKAQKKLERYSKSQKQFQIKFERKSDNENHFRTKINIVRGEKRYKYSNKGAFHKIVNQKSRIIGDKPSVTKSINAYTPQTIGGKNIKKTAQAVNFAVHDVTQTAVDVGLGAETIGMKAFEEGHRTIRRKYVQKYKSEALDDYHKGVIKLGDTTADAVKGTYSHFKQKKQFKLEKARYRLKKAEYKLFKAEELKDKSKKLKHQKKATKLKFKQLKDDFKSFDKSKPIVTKEDVFNRDVRKIRFKKHSKQLKNEKKQNTNKLKELKSENRFKKKELKKQWRIADLSRPAPLVFKPASYTSKQMASSGWQKAVNEDDTDDFMKVADEVKRHGVDKALEEMKPHKLKEKNQKKKSKLENRQKNKQQKLKKQENKLKDKQKELHNYKKRRKNKKPNMLAEFLKQLKNMAQEDAKKFLITLLFPVLIILLIFLLIFSLFSSIAGSSGFILGTYAAQDYDLSEAEKYYTKLAWEMNEKVRLVGNASTWKTGLARFGIDTKNMKDEPDSIYWGNSTKYNWQPNYDFDTYKLWCFLCAYYYDFDADDNGDIKYWKYTSDTERLIKEIFDVEYQFVYSYDNTSRWEEYSPYHYWGGGSSETGSYYRCEKDMFVYTGVPYKYRFKPISITGELSKYCDSEGYLCITSDYRVLNPKDDYELTGFYVMDNRYYSGTKEPFYLYDDESKKFYFMTGEERHDRSFWGFDREDAWFVVSPEDTQIWNPNIKDVCVYGYYEKYYWVTDCRLYYSVKTKKSFDRVIKDKLKSKSHSAERLQYYNLLYGTDSGEMYGNHQTLKSIFGYSIHDYSVTNGYGYDMQNWNEKHCKITGMHEGIDVVVNENTMLQAPFDCTIKRINTSANSVVLRKNDVEYWYDGNGGTKRDTEVYISNISLISGLKVGDTLKMYESFGYSTGNKNCDSSVSNNSTCHYVHIKVKIDTDGAGWNFIDPRLVLY